MNLVLLPINLSTYATQILQWARNHPVDQECSKVKNSRDTYLWVGAQGNKKAHWVFLAEKLTTHSCASKKKQPYDFFFFFFKNKQQLFLFLLQVLVEFNNGYSCYV